MTRETLAELLCNFAGDNPNDETAWAAALIEADQQLEAAQRGEDGAAWWEEPE